jgi:hypothetical protein
VCGSLCKTQATRLSYSPKGKHCCYTDRALCNVITVPSQGRSASATKQYLTRRRFAVRVVSRTPIRIPRCRPGAMSALVVRAGDPYAVAIYQPRCVQLMADISLLDVGNRTCQFTNLSVATAATQSQGHVPNLRRYLASIVYLAGAEQQGELTYVGEHSLMTQRHSYTAISIPRRMRAFAAERPPIPPPTMAARMR